jgi:hypothetical protein
MLATCHSLGPEPIVRTASPPGCSGLTNSNYGEADYRPVQHLQASPYACILVVLADMCNVLKGRHVPAGH